MEIPNQEGAIPVGPIPLNSTYGGGGNGHGHMIHHEPAPHNHIIPTTTSPQIPTTALVEDHVPYKKMVRYRECLKNHAATMGGNATDGCGEFLPSGEQGTLQALTCSVCNCHRNFHRKEIEGEPSSCDYYFDTRVGKKLILGHQRSILGPESLGYPPGYPTRPPPQGHPHPHPHHHQMIMSYNMGGLGSLPSESDEQEDGGGGGGGGLPQMGRKRFRTKFSQEQKEKMLNFAEKVGWKIQKQEESVVQQFCQEVGVKRRVLKVWMHNNKHNLAKKNPSTDSTPQNHI